MKREETRRGYKRWGRETRRGEKIRDGEEERGEGKTKGGTVEEREGDKEIRDSKQGEERRDKWD